MFGIYCTAFIGLLACIAVFVIGFIPPDQINVGSTVLYETLMITGMVVFIAPVYFLIKKGK
ncbi:MAG: hypothetical protein LRY43_03030 [Gammaproteobacteria bacterium]|nr:hypothetical protein [Gammaproteobacteria bacterium]